MAKRPPIPTHRHSLWDRLTDPKLLRGPGVGVTEAGEVERIKNSIRRDLEWLLNSRRAPFDIPEGLTSLASSLVMYGLPDFTGVHASSGYRHDLARALEDTVRDFEPRLTGVKVSYDDDEKARSAESIHYRISAELKLDPSTGHPVAFDTVLDLSSQVFTVKPEGA